MALKNISGLITEKVKLNGVSIKLTHTASVKLDKVLSSECKSVNNAALRKMAKETIKF